MVIFLFIIVTGCDNSKKEWEKTKTENSIQAYTRFIKEYPNDVNIGKAKEAIALLECLTWPPFDTTNNIISKIDTGTKVVYDWKFTSSGMHGVNAYFGLDNPMDYNDVKSMYSNYGTKKSDEEINKNVFKIKGYFSSELGSKKVKAKFSTWVKLFDSTNTNSIGWGLVIDSGEIIIDTKQLTTADVKYFFKNSVKLETVGQAKTLIQVGGDLNKLLLLHKNGFQGNAIFEPVLNTIGTICKHNTCDFEVKRDGWYSNNNLLTKTK